MDIQRAKEILTELADGVDPFTGEVLPPEDSCNQVDVVRALHAVLLELNTSSKIAREQPQNAGKPWTESEADKLVDAFDSGMTINTIAKEFGRSRGAIRAKLAALGIIEDTYYIKKSR